MSKDEIISRQKEEIAELKLELEQLSALRFAFEAAMVQLQQMELKIKELEAQINANSTNSSKPPSSDGLKKKPAFPRKKGGRRGGLPGHKGNTLKMVAQVDDEEIHGPTNSTCECGCCLSGVPIELLNEKRQVFDLPPRLLQVTQHQVGTKKCPGCGITHRGNFPANVNAPTQYGTHVHALIGLLNVEQSLPVGRICELFTSLTGYALNENTVTTSINRTAKKLESITEVIRQKILSAPLAHADESGARVAGRLYWVHDLVSKFYTYFFVDEKRGKKAFENEESITQLFKGILVHDCWGSYFNLACSNHGICGAHLLRELKCLADHFESKWASDFHDLLMYAYQMSSSGKSVLPPKKWSTVKNQYAKILVRADEEEPPPVKKSKGRSKKTKGRNLMDRLKKYEDYVLNFAKIEQVPFTNNIAERDIRPLKTKLKVSGSFRTVKGAQVYLKIKGFCSTVRKHELCVYDQLVRAIEGKECLVTAPK